RWIGKLRVIPLAVGEWSETGSNNLGLRIDGTDCLTERERARPDVAYCFVADLPMAVELVAQFVDNVTFMMRVNVADPIGRLFRRAAAHIQIELRYGADEITELQELIRAKLVVFRNSPRDVFHRRPLIERTDTVAPVIVRAEVAAEAQLRHVHRLGHRNFIRIENADGIVRQNGDLIYIHAFRSLNGHRKVDSLQAPNRAWSEPQRGFIFRPLGTGRVYIRFSQCLGSFWIAEQNHQTRRPAQMLRIERDPIA